ncbi:imidazole glycerol phosphate synthase subunit HisH [Marinospirillum alkaliphilum]|uniref:Imidazole glycerol phosphate synthase subunit HisH n=1 Tax=Marinospirillum alkaliphilum DSM 21637 TaxID=1122209 RepID=A0A1K1W7T0_9GAMM|nr:imidazole glycerol phosphate synthase subunit HisH [Marinospirillum alkaliphilum]SFX33243.1 glutamine amidotransferase [Marinospirillum alkaliphilum DSM 21637]
MQPDVVIIDYGMGNLHSAHKALEKVAAGQQRVAISSDPELIRKAERVILPGVGAIRDCMAEMDKTGLIPVIRECLSSKPFLGICVGFQALMESSEENGGVPCLGHFAGQVKFFGNDLRDASGERLKVPHMGWSQVHPLLQHPLWQDIPDAERFYFVHSYYVQASHRDQVLARCDYGPVQLDAAMAADNVAAVQFHPEKSATAGLKLLENFLNWKP